MAAVHGDDDFLRNKEWRYSAESRSGWLPFGAQELVDSHPWTRASIEKNPRFPGTVPPEALFCWAEADYAGYINSGGFVKPKLQCQYYISPENPQSIVGLLAPLLAAKNWTCTVDADFKHDVTVARTRDYMGMPVATVAEPAATASTGRAVPLFMWHGSRKLVDDDNTLEHRGLVNRIHPLTMHTKIGMLELVRERCVERDTPVPFPPSWYPLTFALPEDLETWKRHAESNPHKKWIYKPNGEAMGRGIILVNKITDVDSRDRPFRTRCQAVEAFDPHEPPLAERGFAKLGVIQEYMVNPLLIENRKFAVRVYMLVARIQPLLVYHYSAAYIKRCGEFYDEGKFYQEDVFRHVTNQEFQKKADDFTSSPAAELMSVEDLDAYLQQEMGIPAFRHCFWEQCKVIMTELCLGCKEQIQEEGRVGTFEVLGLDVVVDAEEKVCLLEANRDPSWAMDTDVKRSIIPGMIQELLDLVFWAHGDDGHNQEALLRSPMDRFEVLIDEAFDFQVVET